MSTINYISEDELVDAARNLMLCHRARLGVPGDTQAAMLITARFTGMAELARSTGLAKSIAELEQTIDLVLKRAPGAAV